MDTFSNDTKRYEQFVIFRESYVGLLGAHRSYCCIDMKAGRNLFSLIATLATTDSITGTTEGRLVRCLEKR